MNEIFEQQNISFSFRSSSNQLRREKIKTAQSHNDLQSVRYLGQKIWELLPSNIKYSNSASKFKKLIKSRKLEVCPWRLCKTYIALIEFIQGSSI